MCAVVAREHLSIRVDAETKRGLEREARRRGTPKTTVAESFLREGIRAAAHPGITFRDGPAGRRAALVGGPDVWEVITVWQDEAKNAEATAKTLGIPVGVVDGALGYYSEFREEINEWIDHNRADAEEAEAAWRRRQALASG